MKHVKGILLICLVAMAATCMAQSTSSALVKPILSADSLLSGNVKDVLTSFFQLAFNNLTGRNKELNFNSNPFAVMLKSNPDLARDDNYYKYRALRKTNVSFGLKLDTSYRFNGFSSGIKYALIDKRDSSVSKVLFESLRNDQFGIEADKLQDELIDSATRIQDKVQRKKFAAAISAFFNKNIAFNSPDNSIKEVVEKIVQADEDDYPQLFRLVNNKPSFNMLTEQRGVYDSLRDLIKNSLLWTVGVSDTTYKDQFFFSNILLNTQLVQGFGKPKPGSNWEFNMRAALNFVDDTLARGRDLKRAIFSFEPGFNLVVRNKTDNQSIFEFNFSGSYYHHFRNLYAGERKDSVTVNSTVRIRVINNIWIPLEIKYDPRSGNFFGFLNIRLNFSTLGKQAAGAKS